MFAAYTLIFSDDSLIFLVFAFAFAQCKWTLTHLEQFVTFLDENPETELKLNVDQDSGGASLGFASCCITIILFSFRIPFMVQGIEKIHVSVDMYVHCIIHTYVHGTCVDIRTW